LSIWKTRRSGLFTQMLFQEEFSSAELILRRN